MSGAVEAHYERLLARHYSWMFGLTVAEMAAEQSTLLRALGVGPELSGPAVDLGCGPGCQSLALADLGASPVLAVDTSRALLDELRANIGDRPVEPVLADIADLADLVEAGSVETVVCMGDTLPHLPDRAVVRRLFADALAALKPGGQLVLTFRDLSQKLKGPDRIVPIRADRERIMICILDFRPNRVTVTDVVHRRENGDWTFEKSSYDKLRLSAASVAQQLSSAGFDLVRNEPAGRMQALVARKPLGG